jgi:hypothetical protein
VFVCFFIGNTFIFIIITFSIFIGHKLLKEVIQLLWKWYQDNDTWECCAVLVINFVTVGRDGEVAFTN